MSAIAPPCPITTTVFTPSKPFPIRATRFLTPIHFCAKRLHFFGEFDCRTPFLYCSRVTSRSQRNPMTATNGIPATYSDEGNHAFEQEALVDGHLNLTVGGGIGMGIEATLNNLSKWLVAAVFIGIIFWRHDAQVLWTAMGSVLNSALSILLKRILNQERPTSTRRSDPGMPSSHAQSIFYAVTFINLSMVEWFGMNALTTSLNILFFTVGSYFSWLRVSQQLHTLSQVIVGAVIGSIFSIFWLWSWNNFVVYSFASLLWVRIVVITTSIGSCMGFIYHAYRTWLVEER